MDYWKLKLCQYELLTDFQKREADMILKFIKPSSKLVVRRFWRKRVLKPRLNNLINLKLGEYLTWIHETEGFMNYQNPLFIFKDLYGLKESQIIRLRYYNVISVSKWIDLELKFIQEKERGAFTSKRDMDLVKSGIDRLNIFGHYNLISTLTGGNILNEEKVLEIPYIRCLQFITKKRIESEIEKTLFENRQKK